MNTALKSSSREGAEKPAIDAAIVPQMMETNMITRIAAAGLVALALTTSLSFGGIGDIFHPTGGGSEPIDIGGVFHNTDNDDPDFGEIFNPKPDTVINKHIDIYKPFPDLNIDFGNSTPAPGTMLDYGKLAKLNEGFALTCAVSGTPSEFPDDVVIANAGLVTIPAGTQIAWQIKAPKLSGVAVLSKALKAGKIVRLNGVLAGGVEAGTNCAIRAIGF
jgi:hypothetical protein